MSGGGARPHMAHVLVPMDRSAAARAALDFALATFPDAAITVLHVTNPVEDSYFATEEDFYTRFEAFEEEADARASAIFEKAEAIADRHDGSIRTETAIGQPARTIVDFAGEEGVDHIVLGSHGRAGVARLLLGSVAEKVVRRAPVPVTVVKGEAIEE